jgi:hypothetical protein
MAYRNPREPVLSVYKAINAVQADLSHQGIGKDRSNQQQGYKFRGIDDVYNALSPLLAKHGLCVLPRCTSREVVERTNAKGTALFYVTVCAEFDFVCAEDGSKHTVVTFGEAMDSGDKATNKAMSAAYKYACMQAFSIPTEGDNDADATTHEVQAVNRTLIGKVQRAIAEAIAGQRELGAKEEWEGAKEQGEEFASLVWAGLTTEQRDYIRALYPQRKKEAA